MKKNEFTVKDMEKELFTTSRMRKKYERELRRIKIAYQIAELRERNRMTQKELAGLLNTKQQVISRLEKDDYIPTINTLEKIAEVFHKKLEIKFI